MPARDRAHRRWKRPTRSFALRGGFSAGDAVNALMTISYFTVGAVLEEQAGDSDAGERGGTVEQAPLAAVAGRDRRLRRSRSGRSVRAGTRGDCRWIGEKEARCQER